MYNIKVAIYRIIYLMTLALYKIYKIIFQVLGEIKFKSYTLTGWVLGRESEREIESLMPSTICGRTLHSSQCAKY